MNYQILLIIALVLGCNTKNKDNSNTKDLVQNIPTPVIQVANNLGEEVLKGGCDASCPTLIDFIDDFEDEPQPYEERIKGGVSLDGIPTTGYKGKGFDYWQANWDMPIYSRSLTNRYVSINLHNDPIVQNNKTVRFQIDASGDDGIAWITRKFHVQPDTEIRATISLDTFHGKTTGDVVAGEPAFFVGKQRPRLESDFYFREIKQTPEWRSTSCSMTTRSYPHNGQVWIAVGINMEHEYKDEPHLIDNIRVIFNATSPTPQAVAVSDGCKMNI